LLLWEEFFRNGIIVNIFGQFDPNAPNSQFGVWPYYGFFLVRELTWWFVIAVFAAFSALFILKSPLLQALIPRGARLRAEQSGMRAWVRPPYKGFQRRAVKRCSPKA
jgi:hypothetical protein